MNKKYIPICVIFIVFLVTIFAVLINYQLEVNRYFEKEYSTTGIITDLTDTTVYLFSEDNTEYIIAGSFLMLHERIANTSSYYSKFQVGDFVCVEYTRSYWLDKYYSEEGVNEVYLKQIEVIKNKR